MLNAKNIKTERPLKKLDYKHLGPFDILKQISSYAYKLTLPPLSRLHDVFHVSLLEPFHNNTLPNRIALLPLPTGSLIDKGDDCKWELEEVLKSRKSRGKL